MKRLLLACAFAPLAAIADFTPYASEPTAVVDYSSDSAETALDLSAVWAVDEVVPLPLAYSATGWEIEPSAAGSVRLYLTRGTLSGETFSPGTEASRDLVSGLTDRGKFTWIPSGLEKSPYSVTHEVTRGGSVAAAEKLTAVFDFTNCKMVSQGDLLLALMGVSQPVEFANDVTAPWIRVGGAGDGLTTSSAGTLTFTFRGRGTFSAELAKSGGAVTVALDGQTVETVTADGDWALHAWPVAGDGAHVLTISYAGGAYARARACALASGGDCDLSASSVTQPLDLGSSFEALTRDDDALKGFMYSAVGWELTPESGSSRSVRLTATPGTMSSAGAFAPDGGTVLDVATGLTDRGTADWNVVGASHKVYRIEHAVTVNGSVDPARTLYGYIDLTNCELAAAPEEVLAALHADASQPFAVAIDPNNPWNPIEEGVAGCGVSPSDTPASGATTTQGLSFSGAGRLSYSYALTGGTLELLVDGAVVATHATAADWASASVEIAGCTAHTAVFRYTGTGLDVPLLKGVSWICVESERASGTSASFWTDLAPSGVRYPEYRGVRLPLAWSSTNWTGVAGADATSVAKVRIVRVTGTSPDVWLWTDEVAGTAKELVNGAGEGVNDWKCRDGVWSATFEIIGTDQTVVYAERCVFDLRRAKTRGLMVTIGAAPPPPPPPAEDILVINDADQSVAIYDSTLPMDDSKALLWRWRKADDPTVTSGLTGGFAEGKPFADGTQVGVAGGGGWAIIDRATCKAVAFGTAGGSPHTIERIGANIVAVASTTGAHAVYLYDIEGEKALNPSQQHAKSFGFHYPHGLCWDAAASRLYVADSDGLHRCVVGYDGTTFTLTKEKSFPSSAAGVTHIHDLRPIAGTTVLAMSSIEKLIFFDTATEKWLKERFITCPDAKSFDPSADAQRFILSIPETSWITSTATLLERGRFSAYRHRTGGQFYKIRWMPRVK